MITTITIIQQQQHHDNNDKQHMITKPTSSTRTANTCSNTTKTNALFSCSLLKSNIVTLVISFLIKLVWYKCILLIILFGLFRLIASPPLHLFMNVHTIEHNNIEQQHHHHSHSIHNTTTTTSIPTTNPTKESIYVKGAGFSGFWFHYGYLKSILEQQQNNENDQQHSNKYDYYCYSSGCLSVVMSVLTEMTVNVGINKVSDVQQMWFDEQIHQYEMIYYLIETLLDPLYLRDDIDDLLPRVNILITTIDNNSTNSLLTVNKPTTMEELRILLKRTCWIPYFTGKNWYLEDHIFPEVYHLDGAFTQTLHPKCSYELNVPTTFTMYYNILNPSITNKNKLYFFNQGIQYGIEFNKHQQQERNTRNTNNDNMNNNNNITINTCSNNNTHNNEDNDKNTLSIR